MFIFFKMVALSALLGWIGPTLIEATLSSHYSYSQDDFSQVFHGSLAMAIAILVVSGISQSKKPIGEITLAELFPVFGGIFIVSAICPLIFWGLLAMISTELVNSIFDLAGGFLAGSLSVGIFFGVFLGIGAGEC